MTVVEDKRLNTRRETMTKIERFLPITVAMCAMAGVFVGFNGDGQLHKLLLIVSGAVIGFLIDYIFTGE
jgi:uncharacterized membrane protein